MNDKERETLLVGLSDGIAANLVSGRDDDPEHYDWVLGDEREVAMSLRAQASFYPGTPLNTLSNDALLDSYLHVLGYYVASAADPYDEGEMFGVLQKSEHGRRDLLAGGIVFNQALSIFPTLVEEN